MLKLKEVTGCLEAFAPSHLQENYDNSGLIVGDPEMEVNGCIIALDCIEEVVQEAIEKGINLIIAHHPIVFSGLKRFNGTNYVQRTVMKAIKHDIAIYAIHTNLDNVIEGVNQVIGSKLGIENGKILAPKYKDDENIGAGMYGELSVPMKTSDFLKMVKDQFNAGVVRYTNILKDEVQSIAWCGGSGSFLLEAAKSVKADVFLTSDFKYHQFFDAENEVVIVDIGHFEGEQFTNELISKVLSEKFPKFVIRFTEVNTNPVNYL